MNLDACTIGIRVISRRLSRPVGITRFDTGVAQSMASLALAGEGNLLENHAE